MFVHNPMILGHHESNSVVSGKGCYIFEKAYLFRSSYKYTAASHTCFPSYKDAICFIPNAKFGCKNVLPENFTYNQQRTN